MVIISHIVTQLGLLKNYRRNKKSILIKIIFMVMLLSALEGTGLCASMSEIKKAFDQDFGRINPEEIKDHFKSIVESVSGMKIEGQVPIEFKSKGDVKNEWFLMEMEKNNLNSDATVLAYEFLLKHFQLLPQDKTLKEELMESYNEVYGLYDPSQKNIVFFNGTNRQAIPTVLFHELLHAAQDSTIDLLKFQNKNCKTLDSSLAASALLEGQATMLQYLVQVEQNLEGRTRKEIIKEMATYFGNSRDFFPHEKYSNGLEALRAFPYSSGFLFVLKRIADDASFLEMFENVPVSTEQVLHIEKFNKNERPKDTILVKRIKQISSMKNSSLLLDTTLGESYMFQIFINVMGEDVETIKDSVSGWGGDRIAVIQNGEELFLLWDSVWDTTKDAEEFFQQYSTFSKNRFKKNKITKEKNFHILTNEDGSLVFQIKDKERVLIIEGQIKPNTLENLRKILDI